MGDNLPELLYRAFCSGAGLAYGSEETPSYHNLRADQRYAWEKVATQARSTMLDRVFEMLDRVFGALDDIDRTLHDDDSPGAVCAALRLRFGR